MQTRPGGREPGNNSRGADPDESRTAPFVRGLFGGLPGRYDLLAEILSFGQNRRWRAAMVDRVAAPPPARVLDVATGTAGVAIQIARRTDAAVTGIDLTAEMLERGREAVGRAGLGDRVRLVTADARRLPFADSSFDAVTFTYLLRYVDDPEAALIELARVVRPGGVAASLEFCVPHKRLWRGLWWLYTRAVLPVAGRMLGGRSWQRVGRFLGPSISAHYRRYPVRWTVDAWRRAGLRGIGYRRMSLGGGLVMWGRKED